MTLTEDVPVANRRPLKTAFETVTAFAAAIEPAEIPASKIPLNGLLLAPAAEVEAQAKCNGGSIAGARHSLRVAAEKKFQRLALVAPSAFGEIDTCLKKGKIALQAAWVRIAEQTELINDVEGQLKELAAVRERVRSDASRLEDARQQLNTPSTLGLSVEAVGQLENLRKHLPARITENQKRIAPLVSELREQVQAARLDLPAIVKRLYEESGPGTQDYHSVHCLIDAGFMDLDE